MPTPAKKPARILIVDDHPIVRRAIYHMIKNEDDLDLSFEAQDADEALRILAHDVPDVAIVDISLKGRSGFELIKDMRSQGYECPILVMSMHEEATYAERALRAGAQGYVMKDEPPRAIVEAIRHVLAGEIYVCDRIATHLLSKFVGRRSDAACADPISGLSDRELEVFEHIGRGEGTREIAKQLNLSGSTIETYKANIKGKLDIKTAPALTKVAIEWLLGKR